MKPARTTGLALPNKQRNMKEGRKILYCIKMGIVGAELNVTPIS